MPLISFKKHRKPASNPIPSTAINEGKSTAVTIPRESTRLLPVFGINYGQLDVSKDEIRLLEIHRGRKTDVISCTFKSTFLNVDSCDKYETVSYCWGNTVAMASIEVNGVPVSVTRSAAEVIHRVRSAVENRVIWVDAVCINQNDNQEKGQQVAIMAKIYTKAVRNIVWLGHNEYSNEYLQQQVIRVILNIRQHTRDFRDLFTITHNRVEEPMKQDGVLLDPKVDFNLLRFIFEKPWFRRLWIVQEVALAQDNICHIGSATFNLKDILRIGAWLGYNATCTPLGFVDHLAIPEAVTLWYFVDRTVVPKATRYALATSMFDLRVALQGFEAKNPHDFVYATLGLLVMTPEDKQRHRAALKIDYKKDIRHVFRDATRAFIETQESPDVLQFRSANFNVPPSIDPSWALDLRHTWADNPNPPPIPDLFNASGGIPMSSNTYNRAGDPDLLSLKGILIDVVKEQTDCFEWHNDATSEEFHATLNQAFELLQRAFRGNTQETATKMARTLMADTDWLGHRRADANDLAEFTDFKEHIESYGELPPSRNNHNIWQYDEPTRKAMRCFSSIIRACYLRRVFLTKEGLVGIGPGDLASDDLIVILHGGKTPYALRKDVNGRYKWLGGCYVYGIMDGEAVRQRRTGSRNDIRFEIV